MAKPSTSKSKTIGIPEKKTKGEPIKIYIAGKFECQRSLRAQAHILWEMGHEVVSSWLNETTKPAGMPHDVFMRKLAMKDIAEIQGADLLIQDTFEMSDRGGAATEFGLALRGFQSKQVWIVGPLRSVFHYLCDRHFDTWNECIAALNS